MKPLPFVQQICNASMFTMQIFISCSGLQAILDVMQEKDFLDHQSISYVVVDALSSIFATQFVAPKIEYSRVLAKQGVFTPLSLMLKQIGKSKSTQSQVILSKIVNVLSVFSQSDSYVKEIMSQPILLENLLEQLHNLSQDDGVAIVKILKNLSMASACLGALESANSIEALIAILSKKDARGQQRKELVNQTLNALFNLCRLSKSRQLRAAKAGLIPTLQKVIEHEKPLKEFALPILCDFAHTGKYSQDLLWENNTLSIYLSLLADPYWQVNGLDAIVSW